MRLRTVRETCRLGQTYTLYPLGDIHLGSANCHKRLLDETIRKIKDDPLARWIGMGDYGEFIGVRDPRWHAGGLDETLFDLSDLDRLRARYLEIIRDRLLPIAGKCWALGEGNHETAYDSRHDERITADLATALGLAPDVYTGWSAITRILFEDENNHRSTLRVYHSHGWQGGRTDGAKVNQLDHLMGWIEGCQIYLQGHSHSRLIKTKTRLGTNVGFTDAVAYDAYGAHTGSFLRTYAMNQTAYGERKGYPPTSLGTLRFSLTPTQKGVTVEAVQ